MDSFFNQQQQQAEHESYRIEAAIVKMIKQDPDDAFKSEVSKKYPHVNFQLLLVKRVV